MNILERAFQIFPDNGTGLTEIAIAAVLAFIPLVYVLLRKRSSRA